MDIGIHRILFQGLEREFWSFDLENEDMKKFILESNFNDRLALTKRIIEGVMSRHGKDELHSIISKLAFIELRAKELAPRQRDHAIHAIWTYLLGIFLNTHYYRNDLFHQHFLQWKLASLFHDIAYPAEIAHYGLLESYSDTINTIKKRFHSKNLIKFKIIPENLEVLNNDVNSLELIQKKLECWKVGVDAFEEYKNKIGAGLPDHGILSGLSLLNVIDDMYQHYNPERIYEHIFVPGTNISVNQRYFEKDIVSACTAIFIHNLPISSFNETKISIERASVAFLLKLSDTLQEWERPSLENPDGFPASDFDIIIAENIDFKTNFPVYKNQKIQNELDNYIENHKVRII